MLDDTIVAVASARSTGGSRGVVRLSGTDSAEFLRRLGVDVPPLTGAAFRFESEFTLDETEGLSVPASFFIWSKGRSYTGQNAVEIHTVGSLPVLDRIVERFCQAGVRMANPGEFTLRAFLSGRLDLTQAEAVLGVIDATDERKLNTALNQLAGGLATPLRALRAELFDLLSHLEAGFDFADEDISFISDEELAQRLAVSSEQIQQLLAKMQTRSSAATQLRVVLYGRPNIGKSRLFNALLGRNEALVFNVPGTTRDYLTAELELEEGLRCTLVDTAGDFQNETEETELLSRRSQELARQQKEHADVRLLCFDAQSWQGTEAVHEGLVVLTRGDLVRREDLPPLPPNGILTSSTTGEGLSELKTQLAKKLREQTGGESDVVASTQARCQESLRLAGLAVERARELCSTEFQELMATELRAALEQIGLIVGAVYTEDLLDSIFSRFCVGK